MTTTQENPQVSKLTNAEGVRCQSMKGGNSIVAVGTISQAPDMVALKTRDGGHLLTVADAERLAVMLVKAAMGKPVADN